MHRLCNFLLFALFVSLSWHPLGYLDSVQGEETQSQVTLLLPTLTHAVEDLKQYIQQGNDPAQWTNLNDFLQDMLLGIELKQPVKIDLLISTEDIQGRYHLPVSRFDDFRENVEGFGIGTRLRSRSQGLYQLSEAYDGWMQYGRNARFAQITYDRKGLGPTLNPQTDLQHLLKLNYDVLGEVKNEAEGISARKTAIERLKQKWLPTLKQFKSETNNKFAVRKLMTEQQLSRLALYYSEAQHVLLGWRRNTSSNSSSQGNAQTSQLDLSVTPLPGTAFEKLIQSTTQTPSRFALVVPPKGEIKFSVRVNFTIDDANKKHLHDLFELLRPMFKERASRSNSSTETELQTRHQALDIIFDGLISGANSGSLDLFLFVVEENKKQQFIGAVRTPKGIQSTEFLKMLPHTGEGHQVKMNVGKESNVEIHHLQLTEKTEFDFIRHLTSGESSFHVGTSENSLWIASGPSAITQLQTAIKQASQPIPKLDTKEMPLVDLEMKASYWLELQDRQNLQANNPATRKIFQDSFTNSDDTLTFKAIRDNNRLLGRLVVHEGIQKLIGSVMAKFVKENLSE